MTQSLDRLAVSRRRATHLSCREARLWIILEQFSDPIDTLFTERRDDIPPRPLRFEWSCYIVGQPCMTLRMLVGNFNLRKSWTDWPIVLCCTTHHFKSPLQLIQIRLAGKEGSSPHQLNRNGSNRPHIDCARIMSASPEKLGWSVPSDFVRRGSLSKNLPGDDLTSHLLSSLCEFAGEAKVRDLGETV